MKKVLFFPPVYTGLGPLLLEMPDTAASALVTAGVGAFPIELSPQGGVSPTSTPSLDPPNVNLTALPRYLVSTDQGGATTPLSAVAHDDGYLSIRATVSLSLPGVRDHFICGEWADGSQSWIAIAKADGTLNVTLVGGNGGYAGGTSTAAIPWVKDQPLTVRIDFCNTDGRAGQSTNTISFYTSADEGATWTKLGSDVGGLTGTGLRASNGGFAVGTLDGDNWCYGHTYRAWVLNSAGQIVYDADFRTAPRGAKDSVVSNGVTYTLPGSAMISSRAPAHGNRLTRSNNTTRLKCIQIVHLPGSHWAGFWGDDWDSTRITAMLDLAVGLGGNCVKISGNGIGPDDGKNYPDDATFRSRLDFWFRECRRRNLLVFWNVFSEPVQFVGATSGSNALRDANVPIVKKVAGWLAQLAPDLIVGIDGFNEWNLTHGARDWSDNAVTDARKQDTRVLLNALRRSCDFPVWVSVIVTKHSALGHDNSPEARMLDAAQDYDIELQDIHPYLYFGDGMDSPPNAADLTVIYAGRYSRAAKVLNGEQGAPIGSGGGFSATQGANWLNGVRLFQSAPFCFGGSHFCETDYDTSDYGFGAYTADLQTARPLIINAVKTYPANPNPHPTGMEIAA